MLSLLCVASNHEAGMCDHDCVVKVVKRVIPFIIFSSNPINESKEFFYRDQEFIEVISCLHNRPDDFNFSGFIIFPDIEGEMLYFLFDISIDSAILWFKLSFLFLRINFIDLKQSIQVAWWIGITILACTILITTKSSFIFHKKSVIQPTINENSILES